MASTIVVINGLAITAGSSLIFFASKGNMHPMNFARIIVKNNTAETTPAISNDIGLYRLSSNIIFKKHTTETANPKKKDALNSFQTTKCP